VQRNLLVGQWFTMISARCNHQLNLTFIDGLPLTFYPKYLITVIKIKIDFAMGKCLSQNDNNMAGCQLIPHIGLKDIYNFHITEVAR